MGEHTLRENRELKFEIQRLSGHCLEKDQELATLRDQLRQAQERLANTECPVHKRHWSVCALMAEQAEIDLPAAIERAERAEALAEKYREALTQVRNEMITCTAWREDDPLYRVADDALAPAEAQGRQAR